MSDLFTRISKIVEADVRIELYSTLNQHLVNSPNIILWNEEVQVIDDDTYEKFRIAIKKGKTCSFYTLNQIIPFQDFCIALLCSVDYSLNHKTVSAVRDKTYTFAWRSLVILSDIAEENVRNWIKKRLNGRSLDGYTNALGVNRQNIVNTQRRFSDTKGLTKFAIDEDKITRACTSKKLKSIIGNTPISVSGVVQRSTATPEGQLLSLRIIHRLLLDKSL